MAYEQSDRFPVGPFSGHFALEQFTRVHAWLSTKEDDPLIFFDEVPIDLIASGFEIFCEDQQLDPTLITTPRDLMACCIKLLRRSARAGADLNETNSLSDRYDGGEPDAEEPDQESDELDDDDELVEYTAQDVAGKFARLFMRTAKAYLRGKMLSRLLNSRVIFEEKKNIRRLEVRGGQIVNADQAPDLPSSSKDHLWVDLDVITYDRMSVLLAEITRMRAAGQNIIIEPDMPLFVVSHQIV